MLFFDEADAIFGKRSDVRTHDRYANIESAYPPQRLETFDGSQCATNLRANIDEAFTGGWTRSSTSGANT